MPYNTPEKRKAYLLRNKEKRKRQFKEWYKRIDSKALNKASYKRTGRDYYIKHKYGIEREVYDAIFIFQGSKCAICSTSEMTAQRGWQLDHDHTTSLVRGILCPFCNRTLGYMETRAPSLIDGCSVFKNYLDNPPAQKVIQNWNCTPKSGLHEVEHAETFFKKEVTQPCQPL